MAHVPQKAAFSPVHPHPIPQSQQEVAAIAACHCVTTPAISTPAVTSAVEEEDFRVGLP